MRVGWVHGTTLQYTHEVRICNRRLKPDPDVWIIAQLKECFERRGGVPDERREDPERRVALELVEEEEDELRARAKRWVV